MASRTHGSSGTIAALATCWLVGCSADAVAEAPPSLETAGAFVARERETGGYRLFRTRGALVLDAARTYLLFDEHTEGAATLAEANDKARDPALTLNFIGPFLRSAFERSPYRVIWYRSLTEEERAAHGGL